MGVCCHNPQPQIEDDHKVVVINIFKDFDKSTKGQQLIRQSKTENNPVITIKQLTNNNQELPSDTLIRASETIVKRNLTIDNLTCDMTQSNMLSRTEGSMVKNNNLAITSEIKQKKKKKIKLTDHQITKEEQMNIKKIFHQLFLFDVFPEIALDILLRNLLLLQVTSGSYLYKKGFQSQFFYIVLEGTLEVYKDNQLIKVYHQWDSFGHSSLISNDHVIHLDESVKCIETSKLFVLDGEIFLSIKQKIIEFVMQERYDFINTIIFFKTLDSIAKHSIAERMKQVTFNEKDIIINKGDKGNNIYMIKEGSVSCQANYVEVKHLGVSKYFGIISLLQKCNRTLDVIAKGKCVCFELTANDLSEAIGTNYIETILLSIFKEFLFKNSYFSELISEDKIYELFSNFSLKSYSKNENIYLQSVYSNNKDSNKRIIIILEGNLIDEKTKVTEYKSGGVLGEEIVKNYIDIPSNLIAYPDCLTLETNVDSIPHLLGEEFKANTISIMTKVNQLQELYLFSNSPEGLLKQIVLDIQKEKYPAEHIIIKENTIGEFFYVIIKGRVEVAINNKRIRLLEDNSFFGERACLDTRKNPKYSATIKALTDVNCVKINRKELAILIRDQTINDIIMHRIIHQNNNIKLNDLKLIKHIGNGKFGSVDLVHDNNNTFAIKSIIRKDADSKMRMATYLLEERKILLGIDHPFIGKIVKTYQNEYYVFLLLEYINGQNLKLFLELNPSVLNVSDVKFYISCLLLVIDYLNKKRIIHRDIKLNNLILDATGYIKLIDFGTAKTLNDYTNTIIGTPHYMSPEVLKGKGYSFSCDYWSIGICAFELFFKKYPFGNEATDVMEIYNEIIYSEYSFPFVKEESNSFNEFINVILQKQITKRICNLSKFKMLRFFYGTTWEDLLHFKFPKPYKPSSIDFKDIDFKLFKSPYEEYINRDMYFTSNQNSNYREFQKAKNEPLWAKEFNM